MTVSKVLCVDDAAADLMMIQKIVSGASLNVLTATGGKDALARAKSEKPDLIFLDIVMPDMDGFAVMREYKKTQLLKIFQLSLSLANHKKPTSSGQKCRVVKALCPSPLRQKR